MADNVTIQTNQWGANNNSPYVSLNAYIEGKTDTTVTYHWWLSYANPTQSNPGWNPVRVIAYVNGGSVFDQGVTIGTSAADGISNGTVTVPLQASAGITGIGLEAYFGGCMWGGVVGTWQGIQGEVDRPAITQAPNAPTNCAHVDTSATQNTVSWTLNTAIPVTKVKVQRNDGFGSWQDVAEIGAATSYVDTVGIDRMYSYRVLAGNAGGWSAPSNESTPTAKQPAAPKVEVERVSATSVIVKFSGSVIATNARMRDKADKNKDWSTWYTVGNTESMQLSASGAAYCQAQYTVQGADGLLYSETTEFFIAAPAKAATPHMVAPLGVVRYGSQITIEWATDEKNFAYEVSVNGSTAVHNSNQTTYTAMASWTGDREFKVRVKGGGLWSDWASLVVTSAVAPTVSMTLTNNSHPITDGVIRYMPLGYELAVTDEGSFLSGSIRILQGGREVYSEPLTDTLKGAIDAGEFLPENGKTYNIEATYNSSNGLSTRAVLVGVIAQFVPPVDANLTATPNPEDGSVSLLIQQGYHETSKLMDGVSSVNTQPKVQSVTAEGHSEQGNLLHGIEPTKDGEFTVYTVPVTDGASYRLIAGNVASGSTVEYWTGKTTWGAATMVGSSYVQPDYVFTPKNTLTSSPVETVKVKLKYGTVFGQTDPVLTQQDSTPSPSNPQPIISAGGKNLLDKNSFVMNKTINSNGQYVDTSSQGSWLAIPDYVPCANLVGKQLVNNVSNTCNIAFYAADKSIVSVSGINSSTPTTVPNGTVYMRTECHSSAIDTYQLEIGAADTSYVPYGMVEATVQGESGNSVSLVSLRSPEWLTNDSSRVKSAWDGVVGSAATMTAESLVGEPSAYQWQTTTDGTWTNSTTASAKTQNLSISVTQARIDDKRYYRCEMTVNGKAVYTEPVLINYLGGVVYGLQSLPNGVHDTLTAGHDGTVLVERVGEVDLGSLTWTKLSNGNAFQSTGIASSAKKGQAASELSNVMCDIYAAVTPSDAYAGRAVGICVNGNAGELWVSDTASYADAAAFKAAMAGVKLLYELETPMEIQLEQTDFQDVPTGTVTYQWGTVGESSMTTFDGKAEAVSVTVNRVTPDGTVCIADRVPLGTGMVDWYAPLNTDYSYQVVSNAESGAVSAVEHPQFIKTDRWFCYWDGGIAWAVWNPSGSVAIKRPQKTRVYYDGRKYPVSYDGDAVECGVSQSFVTIDRARSRDIERLVEDGGRCVYKSADGRVFHADVDYQTSPAYTAKHHGGITLSINRIDGKEL